MWHGRAHCTLPLAALFYLVLGGCSAIQFWEEPESPQAPAPEDPAAPEGPPVRLTGSYDGLIAIEGQSVLGTLEIVQEGQGLRGRFRAPRLELDAEGAGRIEEDDRFSLALRYDIQCPGTVFLEGEIQDTGAALQGTVRARDCTGEVTGTFAFDRS